MAKGARRKKNQRKFWRKEVLIILGAIGLTVAGIKAADDYLSGSGGSSLCPEEMVWTNFPGGGFCIDSYEVSAGPACEFSDPASQAETRVNIENPDCGGRSIKGAQPWRYVSQNQAAVICAKAGKRLPNGQEWLAAALGTPDQAGNWTGDDCQAANNWDKQPGLTGSGRNCRSSAGAYDLIGNVWEWVSGSIVDGNYEGRQLPEQGYVKGVAEDALPTETNNEPDDNYNHDYMWLKSGTKSMARGGYWNNNEEAGFYSLYAVLEPSFAGPGIGFRCVK